MKELFAKYYQSIKLKVYFNKHILRNKEDSEFKLECLEPRLKDAYYKGFMDALESVRRKQNENLLD